MVEILNDVVQLVTDDLLHVDLHFRLEIVQPVQEGTDVALQGPTSSRSSHPIDQIVKGESFFEFTHVDCVFVVDQTLQNLEISDHVAQARLYLDDVRVSVVFQLLIVGYILGHQCLNVLFGDIKNDLLVGVVLHHLQDLYLVEFK